MLTFFRRIRKELLGDGATRKYLLYAIGEIALVVIGILIALQINNWNEWRKERVKEAAMVSSLKSELFENKVFLRDRIEVFDSRILPAGQYLLSHMKREPEQIPVDSILKYYFNIAAIPSFEFSETSINRILTNEAYNLIQRDSLKVILNKYHKDISLMKSNYEDLKGISWNEIINGPSITILGHRNVTNYLGVVDSQFNAFLQLGKSDLIPLQSSTILSDPLFESYLSWRLMHAMGLRHRLFDLIEQIDMIINFCERHYNIE